MKISDIIKLIKSALSFEYKYINIKKENNERKIEIGKNIEISAIFRISQIKHKCR